MNHSSIELNFLGRQFLYKNNKYPKGCRCFVRKDGDMYLLRKSGNYTVYAISESDANTLYVHKGLYGTGYRIEEVNSY